MGVGHGSKASCWCRLNPSLRRIGAFTSRSETSQPEAPHRPIATAPPWQTCWYSTNLPRHVAQPADTNRKTTRLRNTRDIEIGRQDPRRLRRIGAFTSRSETSQPEAPHRPIATAPPWQTCWYSTNLPRHVAQPGNTNRKTTHQCSTWMNDSAVPGRGPPRNRHPPRCVLSKHLDLVPLNAPTERQTSSEKQGRQGQGLRNGFARRGSPKPRRTRKNHS